MYSIENVLKPPEQTTKLSRSVVLLYTQKSISKNNNNNIDKLGTMEAEAQSVVPPIFRGPLS